MSDASSWSGHCIAIIPAYNEESTIAETASATRRIPFVEQVVVVDDGSQDSTAARAREVGAHVVSISPNSGKAAAIEAGLEAISSQASKEPLILLLDADLGTTASSASVLIEAVVAGEADAAIGLLPRRADASGGGFGLVVGLSRWGIRKCTGWEAIQPLSGQRCLTWKALRSVRPLAKGFGVETAMTIDLLQGGSRVIEVECDLAHRVTGKDWKSQLHRGRQLRDVALCLVPRLSKRRSANLSHRKG